MYKNSVLNNPTPSPPFAITPLTSSGLPMFPQTSILLPDLVVVLTSINFFNSSCSAWNFSFLATYSASTSSEGFIITSPVIPSTITLSPLLTEVVMSPNPSTAGISNVLAMIAAWEVLPPILVINPTTLLLSNPAVSDGVKSWATTIVLFSVIAKSSPPFPAKFDNILFDTSLISAALSLIYSLSIDSNIATNVFVTLSIAFKPFILFISISFIIAPVNSGSSNNVMWASNTSAFSAPISSAALALIASSWDLELSNAFCIFSFSAATSVILASVITISSCSCKNTVPIAYPLEAAIPFFIIWDSSLIVNFIIKFLFFSSSYLWVFIWV